MIGPDFTARGLAVQAAAPAMLARLADIATAALPAGVALVQTAGHHAPGLGGGQYVADALADEALLLAHPRFCMRTRSGTILRLAPVNGAICVEQGGARGDAARGDGVDDREAVQAALDYAAATGIGTVQFHQRRYSIWTPRRLTPMDSGDPRDGKALVASATVSLVSTIGDTTLSFRAHDGGSLETGWELVKASASDPAPTRVWRGGGLFIQGDTARRDPLSIETLLIDHVHLAGGRARTGNYGFPADPQTGDGWDVTDKGLWLQDVFVGRLELRGVEISGFKGELFYIGGEGPEDIVLRDCHFHHTNADAMNPGGIGGVDARHCRFGDAYQAIEGIGGKRSVFGGCEFYDSVTSSLWGGPVPGFQHSYTFATRDAARHAPFVQLDDCTFDGVDTFYLGCWVRGRITAIDTQLILPALGQNMRTDIDLDITGWADRVGGHALVTLTGANELAELPGTNGFVARAAENVSVRVASAKSTQAAADAGRAFGSIFRFKGFYDLGSVTLSCGDARAASYVSPYGSMQMQPLCLPPARWIETNARLGGGRVSDITPDPTSAAAHVDIDPIGTAHCVNIHAAGTVTLGIASATQFADRQRLRIYRGNGNAGRTLRLEPGAAGLALAAPVELHAYGDFAELEYRQADGLWRLAHVVAAPA
ncbi:hypothetical protein [Paraurantiacibacter namhicola]|uniref:Pectate lyase superfamily protein n=1 Tax=Paraurantiacibacter namhicola TaxID=645517 RepID=A0A1C7D624_9SPHN|nr:hypothetical protein [Paraurantiacibacter namhicola]ANU06910.1 hypothetical protein A6F65_00588 [Paraurantiacibacter namhicola]